MTARIDPRKARFYPEIVPESIGVTASASGTSIASYANFYPWTLSLNYLFTNQLANQIRIDGDSGHGLIESECEPRPDLMPYGDLDILFEDSMDLWALGGTAIHATYGLKITKLTVLEKIKYGLPLTDEELALSSKFNILKEFKAGRLQSSNIINSKFKKITEISKKITVTTPSITTVDKKINVKAGEKVVLLSIGTHPGVGGPAALNDTYISINRDSVDLEYIKLDSFAMPAENYQVPCYIPAVDRLEVYVDNTANLTDFPVTFKYGVAELTILEKIKWNQPMDPDDEAIASEFDLYNAVRAGVM